MWGKAKDFLQRAFTIIFIATIVDLVPADIRHPPQSGEHLVVQHARSDWTVHRAGIRTIGLW